MTTFNKVRAHKNLRPITLARNGIDSAAKKEPITTEKLQKMMQKEVKEMRDLIGALDGRIKVLEGERGKKRKSNAPEPSTPSPQKKKSDSQGGGRGAGTSSTPSGTPGGTQNSGAAKKK